MSDFTRFVTNKLSGEWSASNVSGVLTDVIIEYLVSGDKWEGLDPLVRTRLLLAPLFMRKRDLPELRPALAKLAAAGAADKDEWVRAMAQSVDDFDGRLHNDRLLAGTKLVARTVDGIRPLLAAADLGLFRPREELYMNKELLQTLRQRSAGSAGGPAQQQQPAAGCSEADAALPKQHHHFRPRPASESPSQRHPGGTSPGGPARQPAPAAAAAAPPRAPAAARTVPALQRAGAPASSPGGGSGRAGAGRLVATDIDSMFMPSKPSMQRPSAGGLGGARAAPPKRAAATIDVEAVKTLHQQRQAERDKMAREKREAAEAEAKARAEARAAEKAMKAAEREAEAKRLAAARAAEKAETQDAKQVARAAKDEEKAAARAAAAEAKRAQQEERAAAAAAREAAAGPKQSRRRPAVEGGEPAAKRRAGGGKSGQVSTKAPRLLSPEAAAAALGNAALAAAADEAGIPPEATGNVDAMHEYLAAAYGQRYSSSDEDPGDI